MLGLILDRRELYGTVLAFLTILTMCRKVLFVGFLTKILLITDLAQVWTINMILQVNS